MRAYWVTEEIRAAFISNKFFSLIRSGGSTGESVVKPLPGYQIPYGDRWIHRLFSPHRPRSFSEGGQSINQTV
jgi:hypothetical protein